MWKSVGRNTFLIVIHENILLFGESHIFHGQHYYFAGVPMMVVIIIIFKFYVLNIGPKHQ